MGDGRDDELTTSASSDFSARTTVSGVHSLSVEILLEILPHAVPNPRWMDQAPTAASVTHSDHKDWLYVRRLIAVCSHWRAVALDTPSLWVYAEPIHVPATIFHEFCARARGLPLDLRLRLPLTLTTPNTMNAIRQKLCHCRRISVDFGPLPKVSQHATTIHLLGDLFLGFDKSTILEDISVAMSPSQVETRHARRYKRLYRLPLPEKAYFPSTRKLHLYGILPRSSRLFGNLTYIDISNCFHVEHGHQAILEMLRENRLVEHVSLCHRNSGYHFVETLDGVSHTDLIHLEHLQSLLVEERPTWIRKLLSHLVTPSTASLSLSSDQFAPASGLYSLLPPASHLSNLGAFYATSSLSVHAVGRSYSITGWNAEGVKLINIAPYEANARFDDTTPDFLDDGIFLDPLPLNIVTALQFTMAFPADDMSYDMFYDMSYDMSYDTWYDMLRHFPNLRVLSVGGDRTKGAFSCLANNPVHLCSQLRVVHIDNGQFGADAQIEILRFMRARGAMLQRFIVLQDTTEEDIEYTRQVDILFAALRPVVKSANTLRRIPKSSAPPWWQDT